MALTQAQSLAGTDNLYFPDVLCAAVRAYRDARSLHEGFAALASHFGFDSFSYLVLSDRSSVGTLAKHWTTIGAKWEGRYDSHRYHVLDPRVTMTGAAVSRLSGIACMNPRTRESSRFSRTPIGLRFAVALRFRYSMRAGDARSLLGIPLRVALIPDETLRFGVRSEILF
jgi:hypothetical protein